LLIVQRSCPKPNTETIKTVDHKRTRPFFRQSGWMMIAAIAGGALTWLVHFLAKSIPNHNTPSRTLLMVVACMPTMPLQMIFAQQRRWRWRPSRTTTGGHDPADVAVTFIVWALGALAVLCVPKANRGGCIYRAGGLVGDIATVAGVIVAAAVFGVVQGRQGLFLAGLGGDSGGSGRLLWRQSWCRAGFGAAGMMAGALLGVGFSALVVIWRSRDLWSLRPEAFDGKSLMKAVVR